MAHRHTHRRSFDHAETMSLRGFRWVLRPATRRIYARSPRDVSVTTMPIIGAAD
jgi:hypothetical protein